MMQDDSTGQAGESEWPEAKAQIEAEAQAEIEARAEALEGVRRLMADPDPKYRHLQEALAAEYLRDIAGVERRLDQWVRNQFRVLSGGRA
jgi:hypothetical protein